MIKELLEKLGFSDKETLTYLTLVQRGRMTANQLAQATKLNRTTTYGVLNNLINKNLIIEDLASPTSVYVPAPISSLVDMFDRREHEARKQKELATRAATEIGRMVSNQPVHLAKIMYVDEQDIESHLINRTPQWCSTLFNGDKVWRGFQDFRLLQNFPDYFDELYSKLLPENFSQELIVEDLPVEVEFQKHNPLPKRKVKVWQHGYDFTYSTWIIGDYVIMIQAKDHPFSLLEIKDPALAKNFNDLFSGVWKLIK